jgi:hypothetical protein
MMKPLVYYCRWQGAALRLRGRDAAAVWGELVFTEADGRERPQPFRYDLRAAAITLETADGPQTLRLDEMGIAQA